MPKTLRHLILSSDEKTWKFNQPVIFLDEWCFTFKQKHTYKDIDAIFASPYGLELAQKEADYIESSALEEIFLLLVCNILNDYHNTNYSERFWRIVIGHWLRRYVRSMLYHVKTIENCIRNYNISSATSYSNKQYILATQNSYSSIFSNRDPHWTNVARGRILELLDNKNCKIEIIDDHKLTKFSLNKSKSIKKITLEFIANIFKFINKDSDAFIVDSYLPNKDQIKLYLSLGQFPQFWISPQCLILDKFDRSLRNSLAKKFVNKSSKDTEYVLRKMLFECMPICYLEGFSTLNKIVEKKSWPKNPRFIFTSNRFDGDEVFKLWTAKKVERGIKYIVGQHGNNYGTHRYHNKTIEEITSDKFITWGWTDNLINHKSGFIFKTLIMAKNNARRGPHLLLVEENRTPYESNLYVNCDYSTYLKDQSIFIDSLCHKFKKKLILRLFTPEAPNSNNEFKDMVLRSQIDEGFLTFQALLKKSRLIVYSYDSTGILETLSLNIPTIAFWHGGLNHLRDSAKPYYQLLVDVGILHFSAKSAAEKINEIWHNIDNWWLESKVQKAREKFCKRYAKVSQDPINDLKQILFE